ncbi:MAG: hypothetical protein E7591_03180 [Ruminococcaceae bacterium]|nr:hypothetical protein [Oscillospiraceae bacterium]
MMKKKSLIRLSAVLIVVLAVSAILAGCAAKDAARELKKDIKEHTDRMLTADPGKEEKSYTGTSGNADTSKSTIITSEEAKAAALEKAGLEAADNIFCSYDREDNDYDIEFRHDGIEYEMEVDASSGIVKDYDTDFENDWD